MHVRVPLGPILAYACAHTCTYALLGALMCGRRASLEFLKSSGMQPHIIQLHDWHAAAAAMLHWEVTHGEGLWRPRLVLTIHNLDNTGECRQVRARTHAPACLPACQGQTVSAFIRDHHGWMGCPPPPLLSSLRGTRRHLEVGHCIAHVQAATAQVIQRPWPSDPTTMHSGNSIH